VVDVAADQGLLAEDEVGPEASLQALDDHLALHHQHWVAAHV